MRRLPSLTGARFFAALFVVAYHSGPFLRVPVLTPLARLGYTGVAFFFTLSGFVLTWGTPADLPVGTFYRRRFARVWPLTAVVLLVSLALAGASGYNVARFLAAVLLLQAWIPTSSWYFGLNGVTWSLSAEAFYYAITPWLLRRRIQHPLRLIPPLLVAAGVMQCLLTVTLPGNVEQWVTYIAPPSLLPAFLCGHLLARGMLAGELPRVPATALLIPLACLGSGVGLIGYFVRQNISVFFFMGGIATLTVPGWLALIAWLVRVDIRRAGRSMPRLFVRLGEWSFALYLIHKVVFQVAHAAEAPQAWRTLGLWAVAVALSGLLYVVIERPAEDWLRGGRPSRPLPEQEDSTVGS